MLIKNCIKCQWPFQCPEEQRFRVMCRACEARAVNKIDAPSAIQMYDHFRGWRQVAKHLVRSNGMAFTADAVQSAVRRHDRGLA